MADDIISIPHEAIISDYIVAVAHLKAIHEILRSDKKFAGTQQAEILTKIIENGLKSMPTVEALSMEVQFVQGGNPSGMTKVEVSARKVNGLQPDEKETIQ